ncbi:hypothetical protein CVT26_009276 [Gymnopilus dilepis]|uniref:Phytocyanin domain-containing protein n=1 Tax=Gymnopilus dilepis TaxID=231916 RepID=A0A409YAG0_9AGAR|nr:hypothetical protein CVT26_009276 [Gymnopilus dilepis]
MRFSVVAATLLSSAVVNAADILVKVGANNGLVFDPSNITAQAGDTISFQFQGKNHSVTQSTFASPCERMTTPSLGVDSGFMPVASGAPSLPQWSITVNNASTPLWFFCAQTTPVDHCQKGMVFAVNAPPAKSFAQFQQAAMNSNSTAAASGSGSAASPAATGAGGSSTGGSGSPSTNGSPSSAASSGTPSTTATNGALKLGGSAAGAMTVAAFFVSFVL